MLASRLNMLALVLTMAGTLSAQDSEIAKPWLSDDVTAEKTGDDELQKLLKARYREAAAELKASWAMYEQGVGQGIAPLVSAAEAAHRAKTSALELCGNKAEKIAVLEKNVKVRKFIEQTVTERYNQGVDPPQAYHAARYWRLDGEIALLRAKREADKGK